MKAVSFHEAEQAYDYVRSLCISDDVGATGCPKGFVCRKVVILPDEEQGWAVQVTFARETGTGGAGAGIDESDERSFPRELNGVPFRVKFEDAPGLTGKTAESGAFR
jgi:D-alanyl-D-alanine dipeptidase